MEGYLAGGQCFGSVQEASDYKMSQVVPAITADGSLKTPVSKRQVVLRFAGSQADFPAVRSGRLRYRWRLSRFSRYISCRFRLCYPLGNPRIPANQ